MAETDQRFGGVVAMVQERRREPVTASDALSVAGGECDVGFDDAQAASPGLAQNGQSQSGVARHAPVVPNLAQQSSDARQVRGFQGTAAVERYGPPAPVAGTRRRRPCQWHRESVEQRLYGLGPKTPAQLPQCSFRRKAVVDVRQAGHELVPHSAVSERREKPQG